MDEGWRKGLGVLLWALCSSVFAVGFNLISFWVSLPETPVVECFIFHTLQHMDWYSCVWACVWVCVDVHTCVFLEIIKPSASHTVPLSYIPSHGTCWKNSLCPITPSPIPLFELVFKFYFWGDNRITFSLLFPPLNRLKHPSVCLCMLCTEPKVFSPKHVLC